MAARIIRKMYGTITTTSVATGRISSSGWLQAYVPGGSSDTAGSTCQTTVDSTMIRPIATTNSGSDVTASAITEATWSNQLSFRSAATAPSATPRSEPITPVTSTSTAELMRRGLTRAHTGSPLASEVPSLPVNSPDSQIQYWSNRPRFRCSCSSVARSRAGFAPRPSTANAALPGRTWVARKTTAETTNSVTMPMAALRPTRSRMGCASRPEMAGAAGAEAVATACSGHVAAADGGPGMHHVVVPPQRHGRAFGEISAPACNSIRY